jgi:uncharacterized tellurite resistance protein B-like protein
VIIFTGGTVSGRPMNFRSTLINLYFLLINADGKVNERELLLGKMMLEADGLPTDKFESELAELRTKSTATLLSIGVTALKKLPQNQQLRCIGWLCVIANADGFMDKNEWKLIYKLYHDELDLKLDEVMKMQRELNKLIHGKSFHSFGVKVSE